MQAQKIRADANSRVSWQVFIILDEYFLAGEVMETSKTQVSAFAYVYKRLRMPCACAVVPLQLFQHAEVCS